MIKGIQPDDPGDPRRHGVNRVKNRGGVHPRQRDHAPQVTDIAEVHTERGEDHPQPTAEEEQEEDRDNRQKERPVESGAGDDHHDQDRRQAEAHGHEAGRDAGKREDKLRNINLPDQRSVRQDRSHRHAGAFREEAVKRLSANQVERIVFGAQAEEGTENKRHHAHHQQRVQQTP